MDRMNLVDLLIPLTSWPIPVAWSHWTYKGQAVVNDPNELRLNHKPPVTAVKALVWHRVAQLVAAWQQGYEKMEREWEDEEEMEREW